MRVLGRRIPVSLLVYTTRVSANLNRGSAMLPMVCPAGAAEIRISIAGLRMQS